MRFLLIHRDTKKMPVFSVTITLGSLPQRHSYWTEAHVLLRSIKKTCPAYLEDISEIHRTEPYVYSQMIAGKDAEILW